MQRDHEVSEWLDGLLLNVGCTNRVSSILEEFEEVRGVRNDATQPFL